MRVLSVGATLLASGRSGVSAQQQTFRSAVDLVHFGVSVIDKQGRRSPA